MQDGRLAHSDPGKGDDVLDGFRLFAPVFISCDQYVRWFLQIAHKLAGLTRGCTQIGRSVILAK